MYKEGFTKSVWNVIQALDAEKMNVLEHLGSEPIPYLEMAKIRNAEDLSMDAMEMFNIYSQTGSPKGPDSLSTRYVYEDVPKGLVLLESVGSLCGCPTPVTTTLINLAQAYTLENFRKHGASLENLGLVGRTTENLLTWLRTGKW